jgi:hypothetical protein
VNVKSNPTRREVINVAKATEAKTYRPEQLAKSLGISGKVVRAYLRKQFPRPAEAKNTTWVLSEKQAAQTMAHFKSLRSKDSESE